MKEEIESKEYWKLDKEKQELYQQVTLQLTPHGWVDRFRFGGPGMDQLKTIYRLKKPIDPKTETNTDPNYEKFGSGIISQVNTSKEETVEEAATNFIRSLDTYIKEYPESDHNSYPPFVAGAHWQSQTTYTKEQVIEMLDRQKKVIIESIMPFEFSFAPFSDIEKRISSLNSEDFLKEVEK